MWAFKSVFFWIQVELQGRQEIAVLFLYYYQLKGVSLALEFEFVAGKLDQPHEVL